MYYHRCDQDNVQCLICFRQCVIAEGERGYCRNRKNLRGTLRNTVYGRPSAVGVDPVEKEPLHHCLPGTYLLSLGTAGGNFRCRFCQNGSLSQRGMGAVAGTRNIPPEEAVKRALDEDVSSISLTYNEPTVFYEYMYEAAQIAQEEGLRVIIHSNGSTNPKPLRDLLQYTDAVTIDLKAFDPGFYFRLSDAELAPVLRTLPIIRDAEIWLEIVHLVIPTLNDDPRTIRAMCAWIWDELGPDVPLHFSRFFPAYRLTHLPPTPPETLEEAHRTARREGLHYVSIGNVPGHRCNSTFCPGCDAKLIGRHHFTVTGFAIDEEERCPNCGENIPGVWK